jgi:hypothetical protein
MTRILISLTAGLLFSFNGKSQFVKHSNIKFDFRVEKLTEYKETLKVYGTLYNPNKDTVYLLTTSCDGMQYSLQYDSVKFFLAPFMLCNASWPLIAKIPPEDKLDFIAHFKSLGKNNEIKIGFDLFEVEKSFDISNKNLNIFNRNEKDKNIIWADVHRFE